MSTDRCMMQSRPSLLISRVNIRTKSDQLKNTLTVSTRARSLQRCNSLIVSWIHRCFSSD